MPSRDVPVAVLCVGAWCGVLCDLGGASFSVALIAPSTPQAFRIDPDGPSSNEFRKDRCELYLKLRKVPPAPLPGPGDRSKDAKSSPPGLKG